MYSWTNVFRSFFVNFFHTIYFVISEFLTFFCNRQLWKRRSFFKSLRDFIVFDLTFYNINFYANVYKKHFIYETPNYLLYFFDYINIIPKIFYIYYCFDENIYNDKKYLVKSYNFFFKKTNNLFKKNLNRFFQLFFKNQDNYLNFLILQKLIVKHFWKCFRLNNNFKIENSINYYDFIYKVFFDIFSKSTFPKAFVKTIKSSKNFKYFAIKNFKVLQNKILFGKTIDKNQVFLETFNKINANLHLNLAKLEAKKNYYLSVVDNPRNYLTINSNYKNILNTYWPVRYSSNNITKFFELTKNNEQIFFIRKNRIFNKSRYSRNRQLYRTGVYWCLWFNIAFIYGAYYFFYRFSINFGFLWWVLAIFMFSIILGRIMKYRFYNPVILYSEIILFYNWISIIIRNIIKLFCDSLFKPIKNITKRFFIIFF